VPCSSMGTVVVVVLATRLTIVWNVSRVRPRQFCVMLETMFSGRLATLDAGSMGGTLRDGCVPTHNPEADRSGTPGCHTKGRHRAFQTASRLHLR
jgi:hypothetical protein